MTDYTPILNLPEVAPNQSQKEATINTAIAILESAMNDTLSVSLAAGNVTLNTDQFTKWFFHQFFGHTTSRIVTIPATPRWFAVENLGTASIEFQTSGSASSALTATLPSGKVGLIVSDGVDVRFVVPDPTGGTGRLEDLSNVSGVATDHQLLRYVSADSAWEPWTLVLAFSQLTDFPGPYSSNSGRLLAVKADGSGLEWVSSAANVTSFIDLSDVPNSYSGAANRTVKVNSGSNGLIFAQPKLTEASDFPTSYTGATGKFLRVNSTPNAIIFDSILLDDIFDGPGSPATGDELKYVRVKLDGSGLEYASGTGGPDHFYQLADVPSSYTGAAGHVVRVNATTNGLEFHAPILADNSDMPALAGNGGKFLQANPGATALQFGLPKVADLSDGPGTPGTHALAVVRVNSGATALEYHVMAFTDLSGVPSSYTGQAGKFLKVKSDESGLQFASSSSSVALSDLTDGPGAYTGHANAFVAINSTATGFVYKQVFVPVKLGDLSDVEDGTGTPTQGDYLRWIDGTWQADPGPNVGATALSQLTDVALASLLNNDILRYDSGSGKFKNTRLPFIPVNLGDLANVEDGTGTPSENDVLTWKGGVWQAEAPSGGGGSTTLAGLTDVTLTSPTDGQVLTRSGSVWINADPTGGPTPNATVVHHTEGQSLSSHSTTLPWTPTVKNWLVAVIASNNFTAATAASGWTRYDKFDDGSSYQSVGIYYRQVQTGDTATITPVTDDVTSSPFSVFELANLPNGLPTDFSAHNLLSGHTPTIPTYSSSERAVLLLSAMQRNSTVQVTLGGGTYDFDTTTGFGHSRDVVSAGHTLNSSVFTPTVSFDAGGDQANLTIIQINAGTALPAFTNLTDTPTSYVGKALEAVRVKSDETGLEFYTLPFIPVKLGDLADVESGTGTPTQGDFLRWIDGTWQADTYAPSFSEPLLSIGTATVSTYTVAATDHGKMLRLSDPSAVTVTLPANATTAIPVGTEILFKQQGAGQVYVTAATGVTVNFPSDMNARTRVQNSVITVIKVGTDEWDLAGDMMLA